MPKFSKDPLLAAAQVVLAVFIGLMIFAIAMVAIGAGAVATVQRAEIAARIADAGLSGSIGVWSVFAALLMLCALLFMALRFAMELGEIVASVDQGDPFTPLNARRLTRMGWLALAIYLAGGALAVTRARLESLIGNAHPASNSTGVVLGGMMLVLTLFILARVFRRGAEMREDLQGTV